MKIRVIACRVFVPELDYILQSTTDEITIEYLPLRSHDAPNTLRDTIQGLIDSTSDVEAIILAYGLCGNATAGLMAGEIPIYIPKAHDCSQILLGGRNRHKELFAENPSRGWTSRGYMAEEGDPFRAGDPSSFWKMEELVEKYGEENARYVWDTLHASDSQEDPVLYYLDVPETGTPEYLKLATDKAAERFKNLEVVPATLSLLVTLLGDRGGAEILKISPGETITPSWDDEVIKSTTTGQVENKV